MKRILYFLALSFTLISSLSLTAQELWKEHNVSVVGTFEYFTVSQAKKNNDYEIFVGGHVENNFSIAVINGVYIEDIMDNDLPDSSDICFNVSIDGDKASFSGPSNISDDSDIDRKVIIRDLLTNEVLHNFYFRELTPGAQIVDTLLKDNYVYVLIKGINNNSFFEKSFSGFPYNNSGDGDFDGIYSGIIKINLSTEMMEEQFFWDVETRVGIDSLALDNSGNLYCISTLDGEADFFQVNKFNANLELIKIYDIASQGLNIFGFPQILAYGVSAGSEYLALTDGRLPVIINLSNESITYSPATQIDDSAEFNADQVTNDTQVVAIDFTEGAAVYAFRDLDDNRGNYIKRVELTTGLRSVYFRPRIHLSAPDSDTFERPRWFGGYINDGTFSLLSILFNLDGDIFPVYVDGVQIADGDQGINDYILYRVDIDVDSSEGPEDHGLIFSIDQGFVTLDQGNKVLFSDVPDITAVEVTRSFQPNSVVVAPEQVTIEDFSDDRKVYSLVADFIPGDEINTVVGYEESVVSTLGIYSENMNRVKVKPNPFTEFLYIELNNTLPSLRVRVYDITGKLVLEPNISQNKVNLSSLNSGIYFLKIESEESFEIKRIIKQ